MAKKTREHREAGRLPVRVVPTGPEGSVPIPSNIDSNAARALLPSGLEHALPGQQATPPPSPSEEATPTEPVFIREGNGLVRIDLVDLRFARADGNHVELHFGSTHHVLRSSLSQVLRSLPTGTLVQVNRSHAVNIQHIVHVGTDQVALDDQVFTVSHIYREDLLRHLRIISDRSNALLSPRRRRV